MRSLCLALLLASCGGTAPPVQAPASMGSAEAPPEGKGWFCFHETERGETASICERTHEGCMRTLNDYLLAAEQAGRASFTPCQARATASCYSFVAAESPQTSWACSETAEECTAGQSQMPRVARSVTPCRQVP